MTQRPPTPLNADRREAARACNDLCFQEIMGLADILESLSVSLREAAWRGHGRTIRLHATQARDTLRALIEATNRIELGRD